MQAPTKTASFKDPNELPTTYHDNCMSLLEKHAAEANEIKQQKVSVTLQEIDANRVNINDTDDKQSRSPMKHIMYLEDIQEALEGENVETYHVSLLEKTLLQYQPDSLKNKTKTNIDEANLGKTPKKIPSIDKENILSDKAEPRVHEVVKESVGKARLFPPNVNVDHTSDVPTLSENAINRRSLSLSDMKDIEVAKVNKTEPLNAVTTITTDTPVTKLDDDPLTMKTLNKSSRYVLIRTIGRGNFAKVKLAKHLTTNKIVAIKIVDKSKMDKKMLFKIAREVTLMKELSHPNIVKLLEVMENTTTLYLVMEYASGGELFDYLVANGCMKEKEARIKFREMISAVQYFHSKMIVHRDLKAENMLLNDKMEIRIADFGFANKFDPASTLSTFCGSPPYAAPEIFNGTKYIGPEVDIWALGVILFTLVSGRLPFDGANVSDLRDKVTNVRYELPYFISNDCEKLLKKMLVVNVSERATIDMIMNDEWVNGAGLPKLKCYKDRDFVICPWRLEILKDMGFNESDITETFKEKKFNIIRATYMLLKKQKPEESSALINTNRSSVASHTYEIQRRVTERNDMGTIPVLPVVSDQRPSTQSLTGAPATSLGQYFKNLFLKKADTSDTHKNRDSGLMDTLSGSVGKDLMKQYQNALSHMNTDLISDPNSSVPKGANQQAILATLNQMSISKNQKAGMFVSNTIGTPTATPTPRQIMENNQISSPPNFSKSPRQTFNETVNLGKFTVQDSPQHLGPGKTSKREDESAKVAAFKKPKEPKTKKNDESSSTAKAKKTKKHNKDTMSEVTTRMSEMGWAKFDIKTRPSVANFVFSMNTVSSKHADLIMLDVVRVLDENKFNYEFLEKYLLLCHLGNKQIEDFGDSVQWEVEVCRIPALFMNGVRLKRIFGSSFVYKKIGSIITKSLKL